MSNIHLIGIGGVGMAGLAILLKNAGHTVSGCDLAPSPRTDWLVREGISVAFGHDPRHLENMDEVIITPAVRATNDERLAAGSRVRFRGEVLADLVSQTDAIAVCGSHGKTTTSTYLAKLLRALGEPVSWAIGGETGDFPVAHAATVAGPLVVEADESDGTLARYCARTLVVTNCEYDHPDFFATKEDYFACYEKAKQHAGDVIESERLTDEECPLAIREILQRLPAHNHKNARAAIEVARRRGHSFERIAAVLEEIVSVLPDRRFQTIWQEPAIITDYAHHPTEIKCALAMARERCRGTLRVLFQPHRYSRTKALLADFAAAFEAVDELVLCPTYAAFEEPIEGGDVADLYLACRARVARVLLARTCAEAWDHAFLEMKEGDVTLLLGAGDIIALLPVVAKDMASREEANVVREKPSATDLASFSFFKTGGRSVGGGVRHVMGMGSNTWISDLTTREDYVRLANPADAPGATLGIPWMAGIPGTIGGWLKMNAGAFGHSISEVVQKVKVDGVWLDREACHFGYRTSALVGTIEDVILTPNTSFGITLEEVLSRRKKFPPRCCGSVFRNPPGDYAGRLLEQVGAKELRVGGAFVWSEHANVIVAEEGASSSDILALARLMQQRVFFRLGVRLVPEICGLSF